MADGQVSSFPWELELEHLKLIVVDSPFPQINLLFSLPFHTPSEALRPNCLHNHVFAFGPRRLLRIMLIKINLKNPSALSPIL
jgi:hypothetical protein